MSEIENNGLRAALLAEYENVTQQIIHWDTFFWTKGMFFLGIESAAFAIALDRLLAMLNTSRTVCLTQFVILFTFVLINVFLCVTWFLTNVRNRLFSASRFERGREIEEHAVFRAGSVKGERDPLQIYHRQKTVLDRKKPINISSHRWEISIPVVFLLGWVGILLFGLGLSAAGARCKALVLVVLTLTLLTVFSPLLKKLAVWLLPDEVTTR